MTRCFRLGIAALFFACLIIPTKADDKYAGIEIGSRGAKLLMVDVTVGSNGGREVQKISEAGDVKNPGLNQSALATQRFDTARMEETVKAVAGFHKQALEKGIAADHIWIVASSGLAATSNWDEFAKMIQEATGTKLDRIDHLKEVSLTFLDEQSVPKADRDAAFSLDIGSGNTKFGYAKFTDDVGSWTPEAEQIPAATGSLSDLVCAKFKLDPTRTPQEQIASFATAVEDEAKELRERFEDKANAINLSGREQHVFLSGGIVWALRTLVKPQSVGDTHVAITVEDIQKFRQHVRRSVDEVFDVDLSAVPQELQDVAKKEISTVKKVFGGRKVKTGDVEEPYAIPHADLIAGAEVLNLCSEVFGFGKEGVVVKFPRDSKDAWIRSYILDSASRSKITGKAELNPVSPPVTPPSNPIPPSPSVNTDALVQRLVRDFAAQTKRIEDLEKRLPTTPTQESDSAKVSAEIAVLRREVQRLKSELESRPQPANPVPSTQAPVTSPASAEYHFQRAMDEARRGSWNSALASATIAAELAPTSKNMYAKALIEVSLGRADDAKVSIVATAQALQGSRSAHLELHRHFETIQGRARRFVESELTRLLGP